MGDPRVVVGGGVAALVAADTLAHAGQRVELFVPEGPLCGGFASHKVAGRTLQLGLRLLELDYGATSRPPPLEAYQPGPVGHAPYISLIRTWIDEMTDGELFEVGRPRLAFEGRVHDDIHVTADLSPLRQIVGDETADLIAGEADRSMEHFGASGVFDAGVDLWEIDLETASRANHGDTFHERLIEPLCTKITPNGSADVVAALRRKTWMPLYHPRTVGEAARGREPSYRPYRPFHVDASGGCDTVVQRLIDRVVSHPLVEVNAVATLVALGAGTRGRTNLAFSCGRSLDVARPIIGLGADEVFRACGIEYGSPRLQMHLAWTEVAEEDIADDPSTILIGDADLPALRVSHGGITRPGFRLHVVESAHDFAGPTAPLVADALDRCGIARLGTPIEIVHELRAAIVRAPTRAAVAHHREGLEAFHNRALEVELVGGILGPGADSLNEQILQGILVGAASDVALHI